MFSFCVDYKYSPWVTHDTPLQADAVQYQPRSQEEQGYADPARGSSYPQKI